MGVMGSKHIGQWGDSVDPTEQLEMSRTKDERSGRGIIGSGSRSCEIQSLSSTASSVDEPVDSWRLKEKVLTLESQATREGVSVAEGAIMEFEVVVVMIIVLSSSIFSLQLMWSTNDWELLCW